MQHLGTAAPTLPKLASTHMRQACAALGPARVPACSGRWRAPVCVSPPVVVCYQSHERQTRCKQDTCISQIWQNVAVYAM